MERFFTIEVYNRRRWSDRYSCQYSTYEEAANRARELYRDYEDNDFYKEDKNEKVPHISNFYRIRETINETLIHELT